MLEVLERVMRSRLGREPLLLPGLAAGTLSYPFASHLLLGLHLPGLPQSASTCPQNRLLVCTTPGLRRTGAGRTGRQVGGWVDGQMSPAWQSFPKAAQRGVLRCCPASSHGCLTGGQAPPSKESIAFLTSAVKPEHNFPGCHSNSTGKAYYL